MNKNYLCPKCEKNLNKEAQITIYENDDFHNYFDKHIYLFKYEGLIRSVILDYKFNEKSYIYKTLSNFIIKNKKICDILKSCDIIIPVPISKKRNKQRGYNQSALIARELGKLLNIKYENNCLIKAKNTIEQSKLNKEERQKNLQGVYKLVNHQKLDCKKIILLDDIFTTGSTVNECCKVLRLANPAEIIVLTIAKD